MDARRTRLVAFCAFLAVMSAALVFLSVRTGSVKDAGRAIIVNIRLPRMCAALILGGALAVSGYLLQTFFDNPIAGPYVLGVSHGARTASALVTVILLPAGLEVTSAVMVAAAFAGAMCVSAFMAAVARTGVSPQILVVCGVMAGYACSAVTDFISAFADEAGIVSMHNWSLASFSGTSWGSVILMGAITAAAVPAAVALSKPLAAWQQGEDHARSLGVNVAGLRLACVTVSSLLCACVTAFAGPVSFVGIACPHLVKSALKTSKPLAVIPVSLWCGALFCLGCDLIARTIFAPVELSVNSVTAALGAPVVIRMMLSRKGRQ